MGVSSDIQSQTLTSSGTIFAGPARVKAIVVTNNATTAGSLILKDGGTSGTAKMTIASNISETVPLDIPDSGMRFETDVYATIANLTRVTIFYA